MLKMLENKKIRNATRKLYNGVTYRSGLEASVAKFFTTNNIEFQYETLKFELVSSVRYNGKLYRAIYYTPDFLVGNFIIEAKGYPNDRWPLVEKLMIRKLISEKLPYEFRVVHSLKELKNVIEEINNYETLCK